MLILGATPIGNLGDASKRLKDCLESVSVIACEDTRVTRKLIVALTPNSSAKLVPLHDHNEADRVDALLQTLLSGLDVLLVSDAGTPLINDPGYKLVQAAINNGITVTALPGPSAPVNALILSGLPVHRYCYEGFLPPKSASRQRSLLELKSESRTMIFLESKHRILKTVTDMRDIFGFERRAAICRELTKKHEEVMRGTLGELVAVLEKRELKGEICICVAGA